MTAVAPPSSSAVPCIYSPTPWSSCAPCSPLHISSLPPKQAVPWQSSWQPPVWDSAQFQPHHSLSSSSLYPSSATLLMFLNRSQDLQLSSHLLKITGLPPSSLPQHIWVSAQLAAVTLSVLQALSVCLSVWWPAKLITYLWSQHCSFYLLADSAIKQSPIQQLILWNNVGNLYLRPLSPICFGPNHFADPKVLQQWKNRQLKSHFLRKPASTHSPPISIFQSFFEWAVYPRKPWPFYLLCKSRYPDHQTSQSLM